MKRVQNTTRNKAGDIIVSVEKIARTVFPFAFNNNKDLPPPTCKTVRRAIYNLAHNFDLFPSNLNRSETKRRKGETRISEVDALSIIRTMATPEKGRTLFLVPNEPINAVRHLFDEEEISYIQITEAREKVVVTPAPDDNPKPEPVKKSEPDPILQKFNNALLKSHHSLRENFKSGVIPHRRLVQLLMNSLQADLGEIAGELPQ